MDHRTLANIVCLSFLLCLAGILVDADHALAFEMGIADKRFLHYSPLFLVLFACCWVVVVLAFAIRWGLVNMLENQRD